MKPSLYIVPRLEPYTARDGSKQWAPMLALWEPSGELSCFSPDEGHSAMSFDYYRDTKVGNAEALALAKGYAKGIAGAVVRKRLPNGVR